MDERKPSSKHSNTPSPSSPRKRFHEDDDGPQNYGLKSPPASKAQTEVESSESDSSSDDDPQSPVSEFGERIPKPPPKRTKRKRNSQDSNQSLPQSSRDIHDWELGVVQILVGGALPHSAETSNEAWETAGARQELSCASAYQIAVIKAYLLVYPPNQISRSWAYAMPCGRYEGIPAQVINEAVRRCMRDWEDAGGAARYKDASTFLERDSDFNMRNDMLQCLVDKDSEPLDLDHLTDRDDDNKKVLWLTAAFLGMGSLPETWTNGIGIAYPYVWGILADWMIGIQKHADVTLVASLNGVLDECEERAKRASETSNHTLTLRLYNGSRPSAVDLGVLPDTSPKPNKVEGPLTCDSLWGLKSRSDGAAMPPPPVPSKKKVVVPERYEYAPGLDEFAIRRSPGLYFTLREDGVRVYKLQ
ncbi:MAG: hypothetical protein M1831_002541 [Alyxoria varia]|nr:MAG: hypothetical protein M1831_002541 [Alyxoria varia]